MSQRVWTCPCGWRSIAENVGGPGHTGEAPPHCRRCHQRQFTVTIEKHPQITHVCKGCREDFIAHRSATHCKKCRTEQRKKAWDGRRKYVWTPERDQILKDHYRRNATEIAARYFPGWPKWVITHRVQHLGLARTKEKPWTAAEDAFLREHAGYKTAYWMAGQLRTRTLTAIVVRLKRLNISRRIQADGMTMGQLEAASGIDHRQIAAYFKSGRLRGIYRTNANEHERYEFQEHDVAEFFIANPSAFRLDRVDQVWFMALMREAVERAAAGEVKPAKKAKASTSRAAAAATELRPCVGVDDDTPCPLEKSVQAKPNIPARCPDCMLAFKRQLHSEERDRLRRIRSSSPVIERELVEA